MTLPRSRLALVLPSVLASLVACGGAAPIGVEPAAEGTVAAATTIAGCPGAWTDADSYAGLPGLYVQPLPYASDLTLLQILTAVPVDPVRTGGQQLRALRGLVRAGRYEALESNPAIGPVIGFWDAGRAEPELYFVLGLRRSAPARVTGLCLLGPAAGARPFSLLRSGL